MLRSLKEHWPEYFCEAAELGLFMVSASLFTMLLWHPSSPVLNLIPDPFVRRMLTGIAMGGTAIALVFSPLGKRSGAHFNPAVTLTFWREEDRKSTRLNSSHTVISYAVFCLKKKKKQYKI